MLEPVRTLDRAASTLAQRLVWLPSLAARIAVGWVFALSGWGKLANLEGVIRFFDSLGIPAPAFQAPFVAATELVCGVLLLAGLAVRWASLPLVIVMLVAIRTALWTDFEGLAGLFGLSEFLYVVLLVWLAITGGGPLSLDALLRERAAARRQTGISETSITSRSASRSSASRSARASSVSGTSTRSDIS